MPKKTQYALYFADDKDVFDLLSMAKQRLTVAKLLELARRRGLVFSQFESRERLIDVISRLPFGWIELSQILEMTDSADRVEKLTSCELPEFSAEDLIAAANAVKDGRADTQAETWDVRSDGKTVRVAVKYSELDASRTRLSQRTQREFLIEFDRTSDGLRVRHQAQERAGEVLGEMTAALAAARPESVAPAPRRIELSGVSDPAMRTKFFLQLIRGLKGFRLEDVKGVKGARPKVDENSAIDEERDTDDEEAGAESSRPPDMAEAEFEVSVKRVALQGEGILQSNEYRELFKSERYVSSIVWTAVEEKADGLKAEFEAAFSEPEQATRFVYSVRKVWERAGSGELKKGKAPTITKVKEERRLLRLLEESALEAVAHVEKLAVVPAEGSAASGDDSDAQEAVP